MQRLLPALFGLAALAVGPGPVSAQSAAPPPPTDVGGQSGTLSDKLHANDGVIHPQGELDPGMHKEAPKTGTMPVVPPPGSPGGDPGVTPK